MLKPPLHYLIPACLRGPIHGELKNPGALRVETTRTIGFCLFHFLGFHQNPFDVISQTTLDKLQEAHASLSRSYHQAMESVKKIAKSVIDPVASRIENCRRHHS
jgi:hypothetical protein